MPTLKSLRQDIQKDSVSKPALPEQTKQEQTQPIERIRQPTEEVKPTPAIIDTKKSILSTILKCAKDSTQTIYSLDIDTFEDDMLIIRADLFIEFLQQEIEKL